MVKNKRILEIDNLSLKFNNQEIIKNISLDINQGEIIAILGISGCGKTSLFNIISGINKNYKGRILKKDKIGYAFQEENLFEWMTVKKHFEVCESVKNQKEEIKNKIIEEIAVKLGLEKSLDNYPFELSGGMKQRVEIGKLILTKRNIWLLDELSSRLDIQNKHSVQKLIQKTKSENDNLTILLVTHDVDEAIYLADRIIILGAKPTRIVKEIKNTINRPRKLKDLSSQKSNSIRKEIIKILNQEYTRTKN